MYSFTKITKRENFRSRAALLGLGQRHKRLRPLAASQHEQREGGGRDAMHAQEGRMGPSAHRVRGAARGGHALILPRRSEVVVALVVGAVDEEEELDGAVVPRREDDLVVPAEG